MCILVVYIKMCETLKASAKHLQSSLSKPRSYSSLFLLLVAATASNFFYRLPVAVIHIVTLFLDKYPVEMVTWAMVAVWPISSLVNPVLFLSSSLRSHRS